jgi:hypothetical protein
VTTGETTTKDPGAVAQPLGRAWWQRLPFIVAVGVVPVPFGLYFLGFIAMALLLSDRTRDTDVRAGGAVALFWWAYSFRQGDTSPYFSAPILVLAAVLLGRSAFGRWRGRAPRAWLPAVGAVCMVGFAVVAFFPDGYRSPRVSRAEAARLVLAERAAKPWRGIAATSYLVDAGRVRLVHTPLWFVALYEPNPTVQRTADNQPCFSRREVWQVDALDGEVSRVTYDEAKVGDDPCLPLRVGTEQDLVPVV